MSKFYWMGWEDGFANCCEDVRYFSAQEAFSYRQGFRAGLKARGEAIAQGVEVPGEA